MKTDQTHNPSKSSAFDAVGLLKADHQKVKRLFGQLDDLTKRGGSDGEGNSRGDAEVCVG